MFGRMCDNFHMQKVFRAIDAPFAVDCQHFGNLKTRFAVSG